MVRARHGAALLALLAGCQKSTPVTSPPAPAACMLAPFAADVVDLGVRAARGEGVVAAEGCSLLDGLVLSRGFPATVEEATRMLEEGPGCTPQLNLKGRRIRMERRDGRLVVTETRLLGGPAQVEEQGEQGSLIRAARCPLPEQRLRTAEDEGALQAYALAAGSLRAALEQAGGSGAGPLGEARATLARICTADTDAGPPPAADGPVNPPAPLAAMAQLMALTFSAFEDASQKVQAKDPGLRAVAPAAREVSAHAPRSNRDGVCAMHRMTEAVVAALKK